MADSRNRLRALAAGMAAAFLLMPGSAQACRSMDLHETLFLTLSPAAIQDDALAADMTIMEITDHGSGRGRIDNVHKGPLRAGELVDFSFAQTTCGPMPAAGDHGTVAGYVMDDGAGGTKGVYLRNRRLCSGEKSYLQAGWPDQIAEGRIALHVMAEETGYADARDSLKRIKARILDAGQSGMDKDGAIELLYRPTACAHEIAAGEQGIITARKLDTASGVIYFID